MIAIAESADPVARRLGAEASRPGAVCGAPGRELAKAGFALPTPDYRDAVPALAVDPYNREAGRVGERRNGRGERTGGFVVHAEGSFYMEWDVVRPHPQDGHGFVEAAAAGVATGS